MRMINISKFLLSLLDWQTFPFFLSTKTFTLPLLVDLDISTPKKFHLTDKELVETLTYINIKVNGYRQTKKQSFLTVFLFNIVYCSFFCSVPSLTKK